MNPKDFKSFFEKATGNLPDDYQRRLAEGRPESRLIQIPTGLGKTAAVVLAWLWNRVALTNAEWPRRLVYCLPMRTLVDQTEEEVRKWMANHALLWDGKPETRKDKVGVHILMGGEEAGEWDIYPEENAVLIGTQDMLLSRALNRGYGMSRYRWPMHFGLLNNDTLWVMDETQLMGVGVETSAQLDGFRHTSEFPTMGQCPTWWMSATLDDARLGTVDHPKPAGGWPVISLSDEEKSSGRPKSLVTAAKSLSKAAFTLDAASKGAHAKQLARFVKERHKPGTFTLVVVNRVSRAQELYEVLAVGKKALCEPKSVALIHSRFRPKDRARHEELLFGSGDRIVIATQAVEAGVDVSARLLVTELAPWSSLVQRFGRCNRRGDMADAEVLWVDIEPKDEKDDLALPYSKAELDKARAVITPLLDASPQTLGNVEVEPEARVIRPVIRRRDLLDLFDTTPDICGQDLDISRYIRDGEDSDAQFFWREIQGEAPSPDEPPPDRAELCRVSIGDAAKFFGKKPRAWRWNPLEEKWEWATSARPGSVYLVDVQAGGYDDALGWTGDSKAKPTPRPPLNGQLETYAGNRLSFRGVWQTIAEHTALVVAEIEALSGRLAGEHKATLHAAALWHDVGKAHEEFQKMLRDGDSTREGTHWAKSGNWNGKCARPGFRHELASAMAWLLAGASKPGERDLVAYLIAAHHGKVRLSIRSLPGESGDERDPEKLFARGLWDGDKLPSVDLGEAVTPEVTLDLSFMKMGEGRIGPSWLARAVALRDRDNLGPFRLAYLETLLRAADARASRSPTI